MTVTILPSCSHMNELQFSALWKKSFKFLPENRSHVSSFNFISTLLPAAHSILSHYQCISAIAIRFSFVSPPLTPHTTSLKTQQNKRKLQSFGEQMFPTDFLYKSHKSSEAGLFLTSFLWSAALKAMESHIYPPNESHEKSTAFDFV